MIEMSAGVRRDFVGLGCIPLLILLVSRLACVLYLLQD
jgi:hypothetical protein